MLGVAAHVVAELRSKAVCNQSRAYGVNITKSVCSEFPFLPFHLAPRSRGVSFIRETLSSLRHRASRSAAPV
eukprot:1260805-Prymnesium_polylepis.1